MPTNPMKHRFKSGDMCFVTGWYEFDGFVDGPPPAEGGDDPVRIFRAAGEIFPLCQRASRPCFWKMAATAADSPPSDTGVETTLDVTSALALHSQHAAGARRLRRAQ